MLVVKELERQRSGRGANPGTVAGMLYNVKLAPHLYHTGPLRWGGKTHYPETRTSGKYGVAMLCLPQVSPRTHSSEGRLNS